MTNPEPSELCLRSGRPLPFLKKSSNSSSNGEPFGTFGSGAPDEPLTVCVVEMLTTASSSFSASGAMLSGPVRARPEPASPAVSPSSSTATADRRAIRPCRSLEVTPVPGGA